MIGYTLLAVSASHPTLPPQAWLFTAATKSNKTFRVNIYFLTSILQSGIHYWDADMDLPGSVQQIADVIGSEQALLLVGKLPRCYRTDTRWPSKPATAKRRATAGAKNSQAVMYVPYLQNLKLDNILVQILGLTDAEKLCREFGGQIMYPAKCANIARKFLNDSILAMARTGMKSTAVAAAFGVSERTVRNLLRENPLEDFPAAANDNAQVHNQLARA